MKKKILFIIGYLGSGGISKSMVNLLTAMDRSRYEVHLLIMSAKAGDYEPFVPHDVIKHRIPEVGWISAGVSGLMPLFKHGHILLMLCSIVRLFLSRFDRALAARLMARMYPKLDGYFDVIVEYNGQQDLYYMVDKLNAAKKVTFFHSDYDKYNYYYKADKLYYPKVDAIYTISNTCVESLKRYFPNVASKVCLFENISTPNVIRQWSEKEEVLSDYNGVVLVTVGLISYNKGFDLIIEAAKRLKERNHDFKWVMLGSPTTDGKEMITKLEKLDLKYDFVFTGVKPNPYPYMRRADILVHASRFEGKSITLDEAKILCKPIVVTNFSTVYDQFEDRVNASICDMNGESLVDAIEELIRYNELRKSYVNYLSEHIVDNSSEVEKIYALF